MFKADRVIIATSFWAREMVAQLGIDVPLFALEHHEIITEAHPELAALDFELPTIRDPFMLGNVRQERDGFLIGIYEQNPVARNTDGIPPEFGQELLPPGIDRLLPNLERCMERFPAISQVRIKVANNGPICYAPDGFPMLGPMASHEGLWLASGFNVGIGTGGGAGQFLSEWIATGAPPYQLSCVDPARFKNAIKPVDAIAGILGHYAAGSATPEPNVAV